MRFRALLHAPGDHARRLQLRFTVRQPFAIVSNNCWGSGFYRDLGIPYNTPFIGLHIPPPCYLRLLDDLPGRLAQPLRFIEKSRYEWATPWPVAELGDVEIHFMHYGSAAEAREKWTRRLARFPTDPGQWRVKFCDHHIDFRNREAADAMLSAFDRTPFASKICFVGRTETWLQSGVAVKEFAGAGRVSDGHALYRPSLRYFRAAAWLNGQAF